MTTNKCPKEFYSDISSGGRQLSNKLEATLKKLDTIQSIAAFAALAGSTVKGRLKRWQ
jgi:hypothetical protein